ncbi:MAG: amino acid permease [Elusimicrobiaceae bacterium]|nr:amino acid permease [Elusimicrobiaceae bacterium]
MLKQLFRTKSVDSILADSHERGHELKKVLGAFDVTMMGIGAIIGAGIFAMIGEAALGASRGYPAGPALMISFLITSVACGFTALCYAEFAAMVPISGSAYTYSYATMGELVAWLIGWDLILEYAIGNVAVAISWAGYFNSLLESTIGMSVPLWLRCDYMSFVKAGSDLTAVPHLFGIPIVFNLLAMLIVLAITWLLVIGIKESARFNHAVVIFKLAILAIFVGAGFYYFDVKNWTPFAPGGLKGIQIGAATIFFAYIGFDAVSTVAEETKNPKRDMPIGIIGSLLACTVIYVLVTAALTGMMPLDALRNGVAEPLATALEYNHASRWLISLISIGAVVATSAVLLVFQIGQPRILFAMSRDGLLPGGLSKVHPKYMTPHVTTIWTGVVVAVGSSVTTLSEMANLCNIGTLFAFVLVCVGIMILRVKDPDRPRPFRVPGGHIIPVLGIAFCIYLMAGLDTMTWLCVDRGRADNLHRVRPASQPPERAAQNERTPNRRTTGLSQRSKNGSRRACAGIRF